MNGAQVGIFEQGDEVSLNGLLQSTDGRGLEAQVGLEVLSNLTDQALEGELSDEELSGLLVATDFSESDGTLELLVASSRVGLHMTLPGLYL